MYLASHSLLGPAWSKRTSWQEREGVPSRKDAGKREAGMRNEAETGHRTIRSGRNKPDYLFSRASSARLALLLSLVQLTHVHRPGFVSARLESYLLSLQRRYVSQVPFIVVRPVSRSSLIIAGITSRVPIAPRSNDNSAVSRGPMKSELFLLRRIDSSCDSISLVDPQLHRYREVARSS